MQRGRNKPTRLTYNNFTISGFEGFFQIIAETIFPFVSIHFNLSHIQKIRGNLVYIDDTRLPIAKPRREELLKFVVYSSLISK